MNDLGRGILDQRDTLMAAMSKVLDSGWVVLGPQVRSFEEALAAYVGVTHTIGVASGTDALELALKATMPAGRRTVVTAANAGGYTSVAAQRAGFELSYADVGPDTLCLTRASVEAVLTDQVGVVVVTHLYGNLTDLSDILALCREHGVAVVEDCAQAIGARRDTGAAGSFGDAAAVSFYPTKNLGALGDGGAVMTSDDAVADRVRALRTYGWGSKYDVTLPGGVNSRLDELQAAILLTRLSALDAGNARRREIVTRYAAAAAATDIRVLPADGEHHVAHLAVAQSDDREAVRAYLIAQGVQTDVHFPIPDYRQSGLGAAAAPHLPATEHAVATIFSLPCFPELTDDEVDAVAVALENYRKEGAR